MPKRGKVGQGRPGGKGDRAKRRVTRSDLHEAVATPDAEDIALARLQAHLRRTETIHGSARPVVSDLRRSTVRLPSALLDRLRERARRDRMTASEVVERALERFLRLR